MKLFTVILAIMGCALGGRLACLAKTLDVRESAEQIDALLREDWLRHQLSANPPASDEVFVRRIYLDVVGRIPTRREAGEFLEDRESGKRAALIDRLLASDGHAQHMFNFWADILRAQSRANGGQGEMTAKPYVEHLKKRIRENQPYDEFVRELLTAEGKVWDNPAIGYYMRDLGMPLDNLANTSRIFLGTRIECAQCHNHPFDRWTQMQFYQMAAFTYPIETNFTGIAARGEMMRMRRMAEKKPALATRAHWIPSIFENLGDFVRYSKVQALPARQLKLPHDYQYADAKPGDVIAPATMLGSKVTCNSTAISAKALADWLTSPENPRFTTVIANRLWKRVFGLGLIEPVDEIRDDSEAMNPALLKHLERLMIAGGYDLRAFLRVLYNTKGYQSEVSRAEHLPGESYHFTGPLLRRMSAEQIYDSFVTLIHATPDLPRRQGIDTEMASRLLYKGKLSDALDLLSTQEVFDGSMKAAAVYEAGAERGKILKDQYAAAQKANDQSLMDKLSVEIRGLNFTARTGIHDHVVVPAVARLYTQKTGRQAPPPIPVKMAAAEKLKKAGRQWEYIEVPGYELDPSIARQEREAEQAREAIFQAESGRFAIPAGELNGFLASRRRQTQEWPRSADLESPAPRGHFLREFGQSDREMIENANDEASMAQALVLMNSSLFEAIIQRHSQLQLNLREVLSPEKVVEVVYETLLSRQPAPSEKAACAAAQQKGLDRMEDLVFALINSRQFIFVQ